MQAERVDGISIERAHERADVIPSETPSEKVDGILSEKLIEALHEVLYEARRVLGLVTRLAHLQPWGELSSFGL
jgi:hypothetical protein